MASASANVEANADDSVRSSTRRQTAAGHKSGESDERGERGAHQDLFDYRHLIIPSDEQVEHLLVDEAQDLHQIELLALARFACQSLTVVADPSQKIYKTTFSWASIGLSFHADNSRTLRENFRSTRQIVTLALPLRPPEEGEAVQLDELPPAVRNGPLPTLYVAADRQQEDALLVRLLRQLTLEQPTWTIGVLGRTWRQLNDWQRLLGNVLAAGIKLVSLHSAKGLEFDAVVIPRLMEGIIPTAPHSYHGDALQDAQEAAQDGAEHYAYEQRLLYVALTRARQQVLLMTSGVPSRFLSLLAPNTFQQVTVRGPASAISSQ